MQRREFVSSLPLLLALGLGCQSTPSPTRNRPRIRVMTYNIHHGEGMDGRLDLPRIADVIRSVDPDVVALQEVDDRTRRSEGVPQADELGDLLGMHSVFGKALDFQGGGYGQATLSKHPFLDLQNHALPSSPDREPRAVLAAVIQPHPSLPPITFANTHLDHTRDDSDRRRQVLRLNELFAGADTDPAVLLGDLNATPESDALAPLWESWKDSAGAFAAPTIPVENPNRRIDYILVRPPARWHTLESRVLDERVASDHLPVVATLELR